MEAREIVAWIGLAIAIVGFATNYALTHYRIGIGEKQRGEDRNEFKAIVAELRDSIKELSAKLEPAAGHAFEIAAQAKAIETLEKEMRRARVRIHQQDTALQKVILLLHLLRKGTPIPDSTIDAIAHDAKRDDEPDENGR